MFILIYHTAQDDNEISLHGMYEDVTDARQAMREEYEEAYEDTVENFLPYADAAEDYARNSHCGDMHAWLGFVQDEPEVEWVILDPIHQPFTYLKV